MLSSSNPPMKIILTIIPPRQLFVNISSDEEITTTPSLTTTSSSPTPLNAPSKTPSTNQTSSSQDNTSSSFQSKLQILPPSLNEPTSPQPLNPLLENILDVPPRPLNPFSPLQYLLLWISLYHYLQSPSHLENLLCLLQQVITAIADRIRGCLSKIFQSSSMSFITSMMLPRVRNHHGGKHKSFKIHSTFQNLLKITDLVWGEADSENFAPKKESMKKALYDLRHDLGGNDDEDVGAEADMNNLDAFMPVSPILTTRIHKDHPVDQIIKDFISAPQTRRMTKNLKEHVGTMQVHALDRKSTIGGCQFLGCRLISWQCKKQIMVANSTTEAEYIDASSCCGQVLWIQNQLLDYGYNFVHTKIYIDNKSTICIVKNPVFHSKINHIEIRHYFIRDSNEKKLIQMIKIHTDKNVADLLTKAFDVIEQVAARSGMGLRSRA
ncbi:hypothetical protein Tco_0421136 [Tanacetum coccineum]